VRPRYRFGSCLLRGPAPTGGLPGSGAGWCRSPDGHRVRAGQVCPFSSGLFGPGVKVHQGDARPRYCRVMTVQRSLCLGLGKGASRCLSVMSATLISIHTAGSGRPDEQGLRSGHGGAPRAFVHRRASYLGGTAPGSGRHHRTAAKTPSHGPGDRRAASRLTTSGVGGDPGPVPASPVTGHAGRTPRTSRANTRSKG